MVVRVVQLVAVRLNFVVVVAPLGNVVGCIGIVDENQRVVCRNTLTDTNTH